MRVSSNELFSTLKKWYWQRIRWQWKRSDFGWRAYFGCSDCADAEEKQSQSRLSSSTQTAVLAGCPFDHALYSTPLDPSRRHLLRRITELETEVAGLQENGFSLEAIKCVPEGEFLDYTGFPNYKVFQALFEHLQPLCINHATLERQKDNNWVCSAELEFES